MSSLAVRAEGHAATASSPATAAAASTASRTPAAFPGFLFFSAYTCFSSGTTGFLSRLSSAGTGGSGGSGRKSTYPFGSLRAVASAFAIASRRACANVGFSGIPGGLGKDSVSFFGARPRFRIDDKWRATFLNPRLAFMARSASPRLSSTSAARLARSSSRARASTFFLSRSTRRAAIKRSHSSLSARWLLSIACAKSSRFVCSGRSGIASTGSPSKCALCCVELEKRMGYMGRAGWFARRHPASNGDVFAFSSETAAAAVAFRFSRRVSAAPNAGSVPRIAVGSSRGGGAARYWRSRGSAPHLPGERTERARGVSARGERRRDSEGVGTRHVLGTREGGTARCRVAVRGGRVRRRTRGEPHRRRCLRRRTSRRAMAPHRPPQRALVPLDTFLPRKKRSVRSVR